MDTQTTAPTEEIKGLSRIVIPEVVDLDVIDRDLGPAIDRNLRLAQRIQINVKDEETRTLALDAVDRIDHDLAAIETWRSKFYEEIYYRPGEAVRAKFDPRKKLGIALRKDILAAISEFEVRRDREARLAREKAEAEARRQAQEAERLRQEAEAAEKRRLEAVAAEKRRIEEAEAAEKRRVAAEAEAKVRAEREAREAAQAELIRKQKEEEDERIKHAQEAQDVGNDHKVDHILETPTAISPILGSPQVAPDLETLRIEQELATKRSAEKAEAERQASAEAEKRRLEAEAEAVRTQEAAAQAELAAKVAQAAASTAIVTRPDERTTIVTRYKWDLDSDGTCDGDRAAFLLLVKAVAEGRAPVEYLGYNNDHPTDFRPEAINKDVQKLKDRFFCPGLKAYPQQDVQMKRKVGGR